MIDSHCHLRDWRQKHKETLYHGLRIAYLAGLDAVFEMPNTNPALTSKKSIEARLIMADRVIGESELPIFHGLYAGVTDDPRQIEDVVSLYHQFFPSIVGLKKFAGHSTGNMGLVEERQQRLVYQTLARIGYKGVLTVHCEKESFMDSSLWVPGNPISHTLARPSEAELHSVVDQITFAEEEGFKGTLAIAHLSNPESLLYVEEMRDQVDFKIVCEVTPHHAVLYDELMNLENGVIAKMNPPLRPKEMQEEIFLLTMEMGFDYIGTDHAPHTLDEKTGQAFDKNGRPIFASGIPGFPYYPVFVNLLRDYGVSQNQIDDLTHNNIVKTFGIPEELIPNTQRAGNQSPEELESLAKEYEYDAFGLLPSSS